MRRGGSGRAHARPADAARASDRGTRRPAAARRARPGAHRHGRRLAGLGRRRPARRLDPHAASRCPWAHQAEAADLARAGRHVVVSTGTASGKSLAYLMPALTSVLEGTRAPNGRGATALYLAPTKALAHDQWRAVAELGIDRLRVSAYDGDTVDEERAWIRAHAGYVLTNPDLLHRVDAAGARALVVVPARAALRRRRRVPRLPRRVRLARGQRAAPAAAGRRRATAPSRRSSSPRRPSGDPAGSASRLVGRDGRGGHRSTRRRAARPRSRCGSRRSPTTAARTTRRPGVRRRPRPPRCSPTSSSRGCARWRSCGRGAAPRRWR